MSSRVVSSSSPGRTVVRSAAIASTRRSIAPRVMHINHNVTEAAILNDSMKDYSAQITASTPPSASLPWPIDIFAKAFEEDRKLEKASKMSVSGERRNKIARAWEPMEKELWLERFGGPGKTMERVAGKGTVVLRDAGEDGKSYLRVLI